MRERHFLKPRNGGFQNNFSRLIISQCYRRTAGGGRGGESEPIVFSKRPANRISTELTAGEEFDYKLIKSHFSQVCVIILFDIDFLSKNEKISRIYWANCAAQRKPPCTRLLYINIRNLYKMDHPSTGPGVKEVNGPRNDHKEMQT